MPIFQENDTNRFSLAYADTVAYADELLGDNWEPFAVSADAAGGDRIWFRKQRVF